MTNEEVLVKFLKSNRKFSSFKKQKFKGLQHVHQVVGVDKAVEFGSLWRATDEGHIYWSHISRKWIELCKHFNLKGSIDLREV